ncbi:carboxypeptidase A2-like [Pyxicephalus adspersus]|uniref:carboxypeptidase A2-like n=1 Tax=Pyxicephalus adspersus TaxID=30357 RepID=UPI003B5C64C1
MKLFLLLTALVAGVLSEKKFIGEQVLRIKASSNEQILLLQDLQTFTHLQLDFWTEPANPSTPVDVRVPFSSLQSVKAYLEYNNIEYSIMIEDLQLYNAINLIVADFKSIVTKQQIGTSYEGRPIYVLKFSKLASDYGNDASVTSLLNKYDVFLLIVTNPDGYAYSHTADRMWRKTRSIISGSRCVGVDPNRNWNAGFGGPGASSDPCSDSYRGPRAESEIEVKTVANFIRSHGNIKGFVSIHSYSQLLLFPYGYKCTNPAHFTELNTVGKAAASALSSLYGTQYRVGTICSTIYQASGGSIDWTYDIGIKYSFAFELRDTGRYGFLLPATQILPTAQETWLGLKKILEHVRDNPY